MSADTTRPPGRDDSARKTIRRTARPQALAAAVDGLTKPIFGKRGLADGAIVRHWEIIVGAETAAFTAPEKLTFPTGERRGGTLYLRVANGSVATRVQHREPVIVERINGYFGYGAVDRLHITQGPLPAPPPAPESELPPLDADEERDLSDRLAGIADPELHDVLESLGRSVLAREKKRERR